MMAVISGKSIYELMGESPSRPNFIENYCLIKQLYLKNCVEPISSKDLFEMLKLQGYKAKNSTFRGLLNNYQKYGYICKINAKKPFLYTLTDEGKVHVKNPFIIVDENVRKYHDFQNQKLKQLIEEHPDIFRQIYESIFGVQNSGLGVSLGGQPHIWGVSQVHTIMI